ncbi:MAG TPA: 2-amino-4-hydroxy-6-hydroxymethyldihydropteridine diphosphokinase [Moraxellaceae bacterium]
MSPIPVTTYIGLGANLGDPVASLVSAGQGLRALPQSRLLACSPLYGSAPVGPASQPDYVNAVAALQTTLPPHALLEQLQAIENEHGRVREVRWGPRTLDLDLLLYGQDEIATSSLIVPHPELKNRNFVVIPLLALDAGLQAPGLGALAALAAARDRQGLHILDPGQGWAG